MIRLEFDYKRKMLHVKKTNPSVKAGIIQEQQIRIPLSDFKSLIKFLVNEFYKYKKGELKLKERVRLNGIEREIGSW